MDIISVDDGKQYKDIADVLNNGFGKLNDNGKPYERIRGTPGFTIRKGKQAVFIWLAEARPDGGWFCPISSHPWLNIPDPDEKAFTQVELKKPGRKKETKEKKENPKVKGELAIFVHKKGENGEYPISFFGVFKRGYENKKAGICVHNRIGTVLDPSEWTPENNPPSIIKSKNRSKKKGV